MRENQDALHNRSAGFLFPSPTTRSCAHLWTFYWRAVPSEIRGAVHHSWLLTIGSHTLCGSAPLYPFIFLSVGLSLSLFSLLVSSLLSSICVVDLVVHLIIFMDHHRISEILFVCEEYWGNKTLERYFFLINITTWYGKRNLVYFYLFFCRLTIIIISFPSSQSSSPQAYDSELDDNIDNK